MCWGKGRRTKEKERGRRRGGERRRRRGEERGREMSSPVIRQHMMYISKTTTQRFLTMMTFITRCVTLSYTSCKCALIGVYSKD